MHEIIKLPPDIQKRICAGEVIVSPYNVLKELLENAVDALSTIITIIVTKDNLNIEVHDNGIGISESNFNNLALSHHTSKFDISSFGNSSYGFRGEALASIRCVSNLTINSKIKDCETGYSRNFKEEEVVPIPMNNGTSVYIKNLFFNNKLREKYFYKKLSVHKNMHELVNIFAIKNPHIKFRFNDVDYNCDYSLTEVNSIYSSDTFYDELIDFEKSFDFPSKEVCELDLITSFKSKQISNIYGISSLRQFSNHFITIIFTPTMINFPTFNFILFINNRLVHNSNIKTFISKKYYNVLPNGRYPFVYLELRLPVQNVDVNVHPSKKEVLIEYEDLIFNVIDTILEGGLNEYKTHKEHTNGSFINNSEIIYKDYSTLEECIQKVKKQEYKLLSIKKLKKEIVEIDETFIKDLVYVGVTNIPDSYLLVQYNQYLMKCDIKKMVSYLIYQYFLNNFGNYESILCEIESKFTNENLSGMLKEYFNIEIENGKITKIPVIGDYSGELKKWESFDIANCTEEEVFREIFDKLVDIYKNITLNRNIFFILKREAKCTKEILKTFTILKSLKDLYKNFERC